MVYDKTGIWRPNDIGPHSPYSYAEEAIVFWIEKWKMPADRIVLGVPFYGFDFTPPARYIDFREIIDGHPALAYQDSVGMRFYNGIPEDRACQTEAGRTDAMGGVADAGLENVGCVHFLLFSLPTSAVVTLVFIMTCLGLTRLRVIRADKT